MKSLLLSLLLLPQQSGQSLSEFRGMVRVQDQTGTYRSAFLSQVSSAGDWTFLMFPKLAWPDSTTIVLTWTAALSDGTMLFDVFDGRSFKFYPADFWAREQLRGFAGNNVVLEQQVIVTQGIDDTKVTVVNLAAK